MVPIHSGEQLSTGTEPNQRLKVSRCRLGKDLFPEATLCVVDIQGSLYGAFRLPP
jgi:hypothetical protein